ncbi:hypothetical protein ACOSQ3_024596 [Xanthoceras sorbifolium]
MTNNISECFNCWIDKFKEKPALTLLENLSRAFMKRIHKRHKEAKKWKIEIPPERYVQVMCASDEEYEVKEGNRYYIVKLDMKSCDCMAWKICGIPCKHFVHNYLLKDSYIKTYSNVIHPIPHQSFWPKMTFNKVLLPDKKNLLGRPEKNKKRDADEEAKQKRSSGAKCGACGAFRHNV